MRKDGDAPQALAKATAHEAQTLGPGPAGHDAAAHSPGSTAAAHGSTGRAIRGAEPHAGDLL